MRVFLVWLLVCAGGAAWAGDPSAPPAAPPAAPEARPLYYPDRPITEADLAGRTLRELALMRNTIFARAGNSFRKRWLDQYFRAQPWYEPRPKMDPGKLTRLDWQNAGIIAKKEASIPRAELQKQAAALQEKKKAGQTTPEDEIELALLSQRVGKWLGSEAEQVAEAEPDRSPLEDPRLLDRQLTRAQLANLSRRDLRILRNMVYARRGYTFKSQMLSEYFYAMEWYEPDPKYTTKKLTALDWRNIKLIRSVEDEVGGPMTDREHQEEDGWFSGA